MREELSIATILLGELFVMISGIEEILLLCVLSWATQLKVNAATIDSYWK